MTTAEVRRLLGAARIIDTEILRHVTVRYSLENRVMNLDTQAMRAVERIIAAQQRLGMELPEYTGLAVKSLLAQNTSVFHPLKLGNRDVVAGIRWRQPESLYYTEQELRNRKNVKRITFDTKPVAEAAIQSLEAWAASYAQVLQQETAETFPYFVITARATLYPVWLYDHKVVREYWELAGVGFVGEPIGRVRKWHEGLLVNGRAELENSKAFRIWESYAGQKSTFVMEGIHSNAE